MFSVSSGVTSGQSHDIKTNEPKRCRATPMANSVRFSSYVRLQIKEMNLSDSPGARWNHFQMAPLVICRDQTRAIFQGCRRSRSRDSPLSIFPGGSAERKCGAILSSVHRRARATCANGSSPSPHRLAKTPPKAQSIRFPYLSSSLIGGTGGLVIVTVLPLPHLHYGRRGGDGRQFTYRHKSVHLCTVRSAKIIPDPDEPFEQYQTYL